MRSIHCFTALAVALVLGLGSGAYQPNDGPGQGKANPARLQGMKAAVSDIEKGTLKQKEFPLPDPAWFADYLASLKKECGVEWEIVDSKKYKDRAELDGYNDVMRVEVEYRFGRGILDKLHKKAKEAWEKR